MTSKTLESEVKLENLNRLNIFIKYNYEWLHKPNKDVNIDTQRYKPFVQNPLGLCVFAARNFCQAEKY